MKSKFVFIASWTESIIHFRGELVKQVLDAGMEVHFIAPFLPVDAEVRNQLEARGVTCHPVRFDRGSVNPFRDILLLFRLFRLIKEIEPEYVFSYTIKPVIYGSAAAFLAGVPKIYSLITGLGLTFNNSGLAQTFVKHISSTLYKAALWANRGVFFQNPDDLKVFTDTRITTTEKSIVVNGSGVDTESYRLQSLPDTAHFLMIARFLINKGFREYVKAAKIVKAEYPEATFSLVGFIDDSSNAIFQHELDDVIKDGSVNYIGRLRSVKEQIALADIIVLPSYHEGTPRSILEGMSMGRAVITTDVAGCRSTVVDGLNGVLIEARSVNSLVAAMILLIKDRSLVAEMGRKSRMIAEEKFDVQIVTRSIIDGMGIKISNAKQRSNENYWE